MQTAASLDSEFGSKALELQKSQQGTTTANQKLESIRRARQDNLIADDKASVLASQTLEEMNTRSPEPRLTNEPAVQKILSTANASPGIPVEVRRGLESVSVGAIPANASVTIPSAIPTLEEQAAASRRDELVSAQDAARPVWRRPAALKDNEKMKATEEMHALVDYMVVWVV
jgi:hypothetical protein